MRAIADDAWWLRFFRLAWKDRSRFFGAGVMALVLWFLLGEKVMQEETIALDVHILERGEAPEGSGLFVRVPPNLAFSDVQPKRVELRIAGPREDLARLEGTLRGFYDVPVGFTRDRERLTREIDVTRDFEFPRLHSLSIEFVDRPTITLTCALRETRTLVLTQENLKFLDPALGEGIEVGFDPSTLRVTGPADRVARVQEDPSLFTLAEIDAVAAGRALGGSFVVRAGQGTFADEDGSLKRLRVVDPDLRIRIHFQRKRRTMTIRVEEIEVTALVPRSARRADVREENPLSLTPDVASVVVTVPADLFADEEEARQRIRRDLNLFVDLGDMPFDVNAMKLKVRHEGLPPEARVEIDPPEIDVVWNPKEPAAGGGGEQGGGKSG